MSRLGPHDEFLSTDTAFWDKIIGINLYGPLHMHHVVVRGMAARGFGRVVTSLPTPARGFLR